MKKRLLIIYYHEVVEGNEGFSYQKITKTKFEEQMKFLKDKGYKTLLFSELSNPLPDKALIVSFDDGFKSVYQTAYPIMKKYGIKGNVYLPTKYIDIDEHFMTWDMIKKLDEQKMFEFAAHTHNHVDIRTLTEKTLCYEIEQSDLLIREMLGYTPKAFCMPYGTYDRRSVKLLRNIKRYQYILGSFYGTIKQSKLETKVIPRIGISNDDSMKVFEKKLQGKLNWKGYLQRIRLFIKTIRGQRITEYEY